MSGCASAASGPAGDMDVDMEGPPADEQQSGEHAVGLESGLLASQGSVPDAQRRGGEDKDGDVEMSDVPGDNVFFSWAASSGGWGTAWSASSSPWAGRWGEWSEWSEWWAETWYGDQDADMRWGGGDWGWQWHGLGSRDGGWQEPQPGWSASGDPSWPSTAEPGAGGGPEGHKGDEEDADWPQEPAVGR